MRVNADADRLCAALAGLAPFVSTAQDAGPEGMIHLSYVPAGGMLATAFGKRRAVAWIPAETEDGDLASFAIERADAKMIGSAFRRTLGWLSVDVQAKVLKTVDPVTEIANGHEAEGRKTREEVAYSITFNEDSGLFGNRMVKVSTAAQPEVNLEKIWGWFRAPLLDRLPPIEEYVTSVADLARFKPAEKAYDANSVIEPYSLSGDLLIRVGEHFIGTCWGAGQSAESDRRREGWLNRLPEALRAAA